MKIITKAIAAKLAANGIESRNGGGNHIPVLKLFTPWGGCTWLITDTDPRDPDLAFGLCDLGHGTPEMGGVYLPDLFALKGPAGLKVERDKFFEGDKPLLEYWEAARVAGSITV